jgi:hypothetical protein
MENYAIDKMYIYSIHDNLLFDLFFLDRIKWKPLQRFSFGVNLYNKIDYTGEAE